jgi:hypothetical protein
MVMTVADRYVLSKDLLIPCQERVLTGGPGVIRGACTVGRTATTSMEKPVSLIWQDRAASCRMSQLVGTRKRVDHGSDRFLRGKRRKPGHRSLHGWRAWTGFSATAERQSSVKLLNVRTRRVISVFDSPSGSTTDDFCAIQVKRSTPEYTVRTFERSYEDGYVLVSYACKNGLDGKVSRIRIN